MAINYLCSTYVPLLFITSVVLPTSAATTTVTATASAESVSDGGGGSSIGIIVGAQIGIIFCIMGLIVIFLWCYSRRRKGKGNITTQGESKQLQLLLVQLYYVVHKTITV